MESGADEDKKKFAEELKRDIELVKTIAPELERRSDLQERLSLFYNAFFQKELAKSNKNLTTATWILALSTVAFTISTIYGPQIADTTIKTIIQDGLAFIIILAVLQLAFNILEGVKKLVIWLYKQL